MVAAPVERGLGIGRSAGRTWAGRPHALALGIAIALAGSPAGAASDGSVFGVWRNAKGSVEVEVRPCGERICGYVVWANAKARRDAREGGGKPLISQQILRDMRRRGPGVWEGEVYAPDLDRTFRGQARLTGPDALRIRGCVVARLFCRSQTWTRLTRGPGMDDRVLATR
jgi:uncharacterized protein (DUF2147 family)